MNHNVYLYILVMAGVTYLIRLLPLTLIKKEIKNVYVKSFLYYVPYVTPVSYTHLDVYKRQVYTPPTHHNSGLSKSLLYTYG